MTGGFYVAENPAYGHPLSALRAGRLGPRPHRAAGPPRGWPPLAPSPCCWMGRPQSAPARLVVRAGPRRHARRCPTTRSSADIRSASATWSCSSPPRRRAIGLLVVAAPAPLTGWRPCCGPRSCSAFERRPLGLTSPMVAEAQWDRANQAARRDVTACLLRRVARRADPREHGIARALHAGDVTRRVRHPRTSSTKASARSGTRR